MNAVQHDAPPASLKHAPPQLSTADKKAVKDLIGKLETATEALDGLNAFASKAGSGKVVDDWAAGEASLAEAVLASVFLTSDKNATISAMRTRAKARLKALEQEGAAYLAPVLRERAGEADAAGDELEETERAAAEKADVVYVPSQTVLGFRSTARTLTKQAEEMASKQGRAPLAKLKEICC